MADQRGLAAPVLADDRHRLARRRLRRSTPSSARTPVRVDVNPTRSMSIAITGELRDQARRLDDVRARAGERRRRRTRDGASTPHSSSRIAENVGGRPLADDPPSSTTTHAVASPSSRAVLCSTTRIAVRLSPQGARSASPTSRVPSGSSWLVGSSRMRWRGRIARIAASATSWAWPPDSRAGSRSASSSIASVARPARRGRSRRPAGGRGSSAPRPAPRRPSRPSPRAASRGFWKRMPQRSASSCGPLSTVSRHRSSPTRRAVRRSTTAPARRRPGRAWTCRLSFGPTTPTHATRQRARGPRP